MLILEKSTFDKFVEVVERKGIGHPDSIMDGIVEEVSRALTSYYLNEFGRVLHYNVDKGLLVGGEVDVAFGGGKVKKPVSIYVAGRATLEFEGRKIEVEDIVREAIDRYMSQFPKLMYESFVNIKQSSPELSMLVFKRLANDTSVGVGFYPFTQTEEKVFEIEKRAYSFEFVGKDVKVMARRIGENFFFTVAAAFLADNVMSIDEYILYKSSMEEELSKIGGVVKVNVADDVKNGKVYLTLSGSSAEHGDDGQVGRGNRVNGLITPFRPMSLEAVAGKNSVSHVGKIYNVVAQRIAETIWAEYEVKSEVILVSNIGEKLDNPSLSYVKLSEELDEGKVRYVISYWLEKIDSLTEEIAKGRVKLF